MPKISDLPVLTSPADSDALVINDDSASTTKKIAASDFVTWIQTKLEAVVGWITTAMIDDNAITAAKIETQEAWQAVTYQNSWVTYDVTYPPAGYYKDSLGVVHLRGMVKSGTINTSIFTLPVGYRPAFRLLFVNISASALGRLDINTSGTVVQVTGTNTWVSLEGIAFRAE